MTASTVRHLLEKAISHFGSEAKLGQATGYSQHAVWMAKARGRVTAEMAVAIDRATGGEVRKSALRPDIFSDCGCTKEHA